jgi:sigma-B regulation protein RsbU (phosphoserine phosphatase)
MEKLGGDFFCFYPLGNDTLGVFICDVSGHGIGSSLFDALLKSITDRLLIKFGESPADFITQLNLELMGHMSSFYITGIYGLFTHTPGSDEILFSYANGAHPGPILAKKNGKIQLHSAKSTLIGINNNIVYNTNTITMDRGDRLFLYTDGIPETSNPMHEIVGFEDSLLELFKKSHQLTLGDNLNSIISQVARFRDGAMITDDMLILGIEALC